MVKIEPGSPEHLRLISPSKVAAILGVSRWESAFSLWHRMKGLIPPDEPKDIFNVGLAFEAAMAELWKIENGGWRLSKGGVQMVSGEFGFPAIVTLDRRASRGKARRVLEFKTARHLDEWGDPNLDGDCPADYTAQVMSQMMFTGYRHHSAHLMVLGPFFKHRTYEITYNTDVAEWIANECLKFYKSLTDNEPPDLDNTIATYEAIRELHPDIEEDAEVELPEELVTRARDARFEQGRWEDELRGAKSEILSLMGNAQRAYVGNVQVASRRPHGRGGVALVLTKNPLQ